MIDATYSLHGDHVIGALSEAGDVAARLARQLAGERRILEQVATGQPMADSLAEITRLIETISEGSLASVLLLDDDGRLHHGAAPRLPEEYNALVDGLAIGPDVGSCGTAAFTGEPVFVDDIATDPRWQSAAEVAASFDLAACWSIPIRDDHNHVIGTFATYFTTQRHPSEQEVREVQAAAHLAGVVITRARNEQRLRATERRFRSVIENAGDAFFLHDLDGRFVDVNQRACEELGYTRAELLKLAVTDIEVGHTAQQCADLADSLLDSNAQTVTVEGEHRRKDGSTFPVEVRLSLLHGDGTTLLIAFARDITHRKRVEQAQKLIMRELDHRVKNNLASVLSIAQQMSSTATTIDEFRNSLMARVHSMAVVHEMLARQQWDGGSVRLLVERMLEPFHQRAPGRIVISGDETIVGSRIVQPLCMTLHELATNAAKHGALAGEQGKLAVTWQTRSDQSSLEIKWEESIAPATQRQAEHAGFGTRLIREMIPHQLHGSVHLDIQAHRVCCIMQILLAASE